VAGKKRKAIAASKDNAKSASGLERQSGVGCEVLTSRESPQIPVRKRKADELSRSDGLFEPGSRRPARRPSVRISPEAKGSTGELVAESSRQLGPIEGGLA